MKYIGKEGIEQHTLLQFTKQDEKHKKTSKKFIENK